MEVVLEWRESLRKTTESMSEEGETEYLHQTALKLLHGYGLKLVSIDESSGKPSAIKKLHWYRSRFCRRSDKKKSYF